MDVGFTCDWSIYGEKARRIIDALLNKYAETGVVNLEDTKILDINPFSQYGRKAKIMKLFNSLKGYNEAINEIENNYIVGIMKDFYLSNNKKTFYGYLGESTIVFIPEGVVKIEDGFGGNKNVEKLYLPSSIKKIDVSVLRGYRNLNEIHVAEDNPFFCSIDGVLFSKDCCKILAYPRSHESSEFEIPNNVVTICDSAFSMCYKIKKLIIPDSVTKIENGAFAGCRSLLSIDLPDSIKAVGDNVFWNCTSLQTVKLPSRLKYIKSGLFHGCDSLKDIQIPNTVTCIGQRAFEDCTSLETTYLPNRIKKIESKAFSGCRKLSLSNMPSKLECIGDELFSGCKTISSLFIPENVKSIDRFAFWGCSYLTEFIASEKNMYYKSLGGILYTKDGKSVVAYPSDRNVDIFEIKDSIEVLDLLTLVHCSHLKIIVIPESVRILDCSACGHLGEIGEIHIRNMSPQTISISDNYYDIFRECSLYVPFASEEAYRNDPKFKCFKEIKTE